MKANGDPKRLLALVAGHRTPFVRAGTELARASAVWLGSTVAKEVLARSELHPGQVDEVLLGCVGPAADEANIARIVALRAGVPESVPAATVQRNCASGFESITTACERVASGRGEVFLVGGTESMSSYPLLFPRSMAEFLARMARARSPLQKARAFLALRPAMFKPRLAILEGLTDPVCGLLMGQTAERLASEFGITRATQDQFALRSHQRAAAARASGRMARETVPVMAPPRFDKVAEQDNGIRDNQSLEALAKLPAYFDKPEGSVTVGNSSQVSDGACVLLAMSPERAAAEGRTPLGWVVSYDYAGLSPARMGLGPVLAGQRALARAGLSLREMARVEINEAFAAQALACVAAFGSDRFAQAELGLAKAMGEIDPGRLNCNGGAIALGHPLGASGARLALTLLHELKERGERFGLAALCIGGGQGGAMVLEAAA